jgi:glycosyltransferase involved in cell wall biosynthesis
MSTVRARTGSDIIEAMRILVNALALRHTRDAARIFLENVLRRLPEVWPGAEVHVVLRSDVASPHGSLREIRVPVARSGTSRVAAEFMYLPRIVDRVAPDVVVNPNESIPVRRIKRPLVVVAQNLIYHCPRVRPLATGSPRAKLRSRLQFAFYRRQFPLAYGRADAVVVVSHHAARELAQRAELDLDRAHVVYHGADRLPVAPRQDGKATKTILAVGAVAHYKRLDVGVRAISELRRAGGDYELVLAGEEWPGYGEEIAGLAHALGVYEHITRLGAVPDRVLSDLFASAHAMLALSSCESFGLPVVEAMRAGLPVVVANEPWSAEIAQDAAIPVEASNVADVAAGVKILANGDHWSRMSAQGRHIAARYRWASTAAGIAAVVRSAASAKRARAPS